ncbi:MAG: succinate dehydrogenase [Planctomycetes bacterium RBG_16_64_10]|nr:MAG: succinate dehydrogenase [Planctomycetes bacterium RBG_16_64_10]
MRITLHLWRQRGPEDQGRFETHHVADVLPEMCFLEMLDRLNEQLAVQGQEPVAYEYDCREGICGSCSLVINGIAHGPDRATTTCQLHMRSFRDGQEIYVEPFRAAAFPVIRDLCVDRTALDRVMQRGGYVSFHTGNAPDGNAIPISKQEAEMALDAAACIGCGACVAACPNASASLFVASKVVHLSQLPQGLPERTQRVGRMIAAMDAEQFGSCTNHGECEAVCPMSIPTRLISTMNREYLRAVLQGNASPT